MAGSEPPALRRVRAWILGAGLAGLASGVVVGVAVPVAAKALGFGRPRGVHAEYIQNLASKYGLSREQKRQIRMVLDSRDRDILQAVREYKTSLPKQLHDDLEQIRREADELIEWAVLTPAQRGPYLEDSRIEPPK